MVPDLVYPQYFVSLGDLSGGYSCKAPEDKGAQIVFGNVRRINLSNLDPTVNVDEQSAVSYELLNFDNNTAIKARVWVVDDLVRCKLFSFNKATNSVITEFDPFGNGDMSITTPDGSLRVSWTAAQTFGAVFYYVTDYFDNAQLPYPGMHAHKIDVILRFPSMRLSLLNNLLQYDNYQLRYANYADLDQGDPAYRTCLDYPTGYGVVCGRTLTITNINDFLVNVNGGGSKPYDIGDIGTPVQEEDPSGPGGGEGDYDKGSDPVDFPNVPTGGALASGALKAFSVSNSILIDLFNKLWDLNFFDIATQFQKLVDNPMDCIISLHCIPVVPTVNGTSHIQLGSFDTQVSAGVITSQYVVLDCGSLEVKEFWGSALDYSPYTKCELYMPFIGIKQLNVDDVMGKKVQIKYNIDIFTGDCICFIKCGQSVLYKFNGNLKQDIPLSGRSSDAILRTATAGLTIAGGLAMGGAVGGAVGGAIAQQAGLSAAANVLSTKIVTTRSGSLAGSVGLLDDFVPYFIFHRPVQSLASNFKTFKGYPSNITSLLSALTGYTEVEFVNLQDIPEATSAEMEEIKSLLKSGVIF